MSFMIPIRMRWKIRVRLRTPSSRKGIRRVQMTWPLDDFRITSYFGRRWGRSHDGLDLRARKGTPVLQRWREWWRTRARR